MEMFKTTVGMKHGFFMSKSDPNSIQEFIILDQINLIDSIVLYNLVYKLFDNELSSIDVFHIKRLIEYIVWIKKRYESNGYIVAHACLNLLCLAMNTYQKPILVRCLKEFDYDYFFSSNDDPLLLATKSHGRGTTNVYAEYFQKKPIQYLNEELLINILNSDSTQLKLVIIDSFIGIKNPASYQYPNYVVMMTHMNSRVFMSHSFTGDKFVERSVKKYTKMKWWDYVLGNSLKQVEYTVSNFKVDLSIRSNFTLRLLEALSKCQNEILIGKMKAIINHYWVDNIWFFFLQLFFNCFYYIAFIFNTATNYYNLSFLCFCIFCWMMISFYEVVVFFHKPKTYLKSSSNYIDIFLIISIPAIYFVVGNEDSTRVKEDLSPIESAWVTTTMLVAGLRVLAYFKLILSIRFLISMILKALVGMIPFLVVNFYVYQVFTMIDMQISKESDSMISGTMDNYMTSFEKVYSIAFGQWQEGIFVDMGYNEMFHFFFNTIFLNLLMINLLIAIVSKTHDEFQMTKEEITCRGAVDLLLDYAYFANFFKSKSYKENRRYLHLVNPKKQTANKTKTEMLEKLRKFVKELEELENE
jgi:hypothetical protein